MLLNCPYCELELILTLKYNMAVEGCPQGKWIWLDNSELKESHEKSRYKFMEDRDSKDLNTKDSNYYYYKKECIENGSIDDLFSFEFV